MNMRKNQFISVVLILGIFTIILWEYLLSIRLPIINCSKGYSKSEYCPLGSSCKKISDSPNGYFCKSYLFNKPDMLD